MSNPPIINVKELVRFLEREGFVRVHQKGSHATYKHPTTHQRVTIAIHFGCDIKKGTLRGILNDLGLSMEEFLERFHR